MRLWDITYVVWLANDTYPYLVEVEGDTPAFISRDWNVSPRDPCLLHSHRVIGMCHHAIPVCLNNWALQKGGPVWGEVPKCGKFNVYL